MCSHFLSLVPGNAITAHSFVYPQTQLGEEWGQETSPGGEPAPHQEVQGAVNQEKVGTEHPRHVHGQV